MDAKIALLDDGVGPHPGDKILLADQRAGTLDKDLQDLKRPAAQSQGLLALEQKLPSWNSRNGPNAIAPSSTGGSEEPDTLAPPTGVRLGEVRYTSVHRCC